MAEFSHKFKEGQTVLLKTKERELEIKIIGAVEDRPFYFLDWESCGFSKMLNEVKVIERALYAIDKV